MENSFLELFSLKVLCTYIQCKSPISILHIFNYFPKYYTYIYIYIYKINKHLKTFQIYSRKQLIFKKLLSVTKFVKCVF